METAEHSIADCAHTVMFVILVLLAVYSKLRLVSCGLCDYGGNGIDK